MTNDLIVPIDGANVCGAIVFISVSGDVNYSALLENWPSQIPAKLAPSPTSSKSALRLAMDSIVQGKKSSQFKMKNSEGWAVISKWEDDEANLSFSQDLKVSLNTDGNLEFNPPVGYEVIKERIERAYQYQLSVINASTYAEWCKSVCMNLGGLSMMDRGRAYYIPQPAITGFEALRNLTQSLTGGKFKMVPAMRTSDAVESVLDSLREEIKENGARLREETENAKQERVFNRVQEEAKRYTKKVELYEKLMNQKLDELKQEMGAVQAAAGLAAVKALTAKLNK